MRSPTQLPRRPDRRLVVALFLASTFGMMIVLSLPLVRFLPLYPRAPGLLGLPSLINPLGPLFPPRTGARPPEGLYQADSGISRVLAPILPSSVVRFVPEAVPGTDPPRGGGETAPDCRAGNTSERGPAEKRRPGKRPGSRKRAGVGPISRCELTYLREGLRRTEGRGWTIPRSHLHGGWAVTKHGLKHPGKADHEPRKNHKPKKK
jgi:hypothetical protein